MITPEPSDFLLLPFRDFDLLVVYRASDISKPLYINYREFIKGITASITPASALLLQTNGVNNPTQDLLNLVAGTNVTITDDGLGNVTISVAAAYTVDNGLTENPIGNFQLGSTTSGGAPLLHDTYIDTLVDKTLFLEGQKTNQLEYILQINNTANDGGALKVSSLGLGIAITATSVSASAVAALSTNAPAVSGTTGGANEAGLFTNSDAGTNNIVQGIKLRHSSSGIPTIGFGIAADFTGKTTLNSDLRLGRLIFLWTNAVTASRTSKFQVETVNSASASVKLEIEGNGQLTLNEYGSGAFTGTAAYNLAVDASGNVIEVTAGVSGTVTSVGLSVPNPSSPAFSVSGSPITTSGTIQINALGTTSQYVRGDGSLATLPAIPSPTSVFPYTKRKYYSSGDFRAMSYYNDKLFIVYNSTNVIRVFDTNTSLLVVATAATLPNTSQIIDDIATPEHWATTTGAPPNIIRHDASTGAFIASTPITGVITTAIQSRYASFSATKTIGANTSNIYTIDPSTFVTSNLTAHGLGAGFMTYLAINKNVSSLQNGVCMVGGPNGICLFDCNTNTLTLAATNLSGALGAVLDVAYDPINDFWLVANLNSGILQVTALQPTSATTFTIVYNITDVTSGDYTLTGGNAKQICVIPIGSAGQLYVCVNTRFFVYSLITGDALKSDNVDSLSTGALRTTYGLLDEPNKRIFFATGVLTNELIYAE